MRSSAWLGVALVCWLLSAGCNSFRITDLSREKVPPGALVSLNEPIPARAVCVATVPATAGAQLVEWEEAEAFAKLLADSRLFTRVVSNEWSRSRHEPSDLLLELTETTLRAPEPGGGPRMFFSGFFIFWPLLPVLIPIDFIYVAHAPDLEVRYDLSVLDAEGAPLASFSTTRVLRVAEQAGGCRCKRGERGEHGEPNGLSMAFDGGTRVLLAQLLADQSALERIRSAVTKPRPRLYCENCGASLVEASKPCARCGGSDR